MGLAQSFRRLIGRAGTADTSRAQARVEAAEQLEDEITALGDDELAERYAILREFVTDELTPEDLSELMAIGRSAVRRTIGERAYDEQLLGAAGLLAGQVVEMATGEGKTMVGALAALGFVVRGRRVQVLSVNDYLARRDAEWMGPVFELLGVDVGHVTQASGPEERRAAYGRDVCYAAVSEVGFDLLRDRLRTDNTTRVLPELDVAIIDEADAVMIDEAKVPLVLAGSDDEGVDESDAARIVAALDPDVDIELAPDRRSANLSDAGLKHVEQLLEIDNLYAEGHETLLTTINIALHARVLLTRDIDYLVTDGQVRLIDLNRGRVADLQRWPDGLHAAVEAKEGLASTGRGVILDSMTIQSLITSYRLVCGMTGTAVAAAEQLREFYQLEVGVVPTHRPTIREDAEDRLYETQEEKEEALIAEICALHETGRPVLVGTQDVAASERLHDRLAEAGVTSAVLNAKNDTEEAGLIAEAGRGSAVTVSTQMAGRGVDIRLGGADEADREAVAALGGLMVIGTGRYPTRRLDDQLRGRAGRQGDPGGSVFFTSLEDDPETERFAVRASHVDETGLIDSSAARQQVEHAQRVGEGALLDLHRNSWLYSQQLHHQRIEVLEYRDRLLDEDLAATELAEAAPERWAELAEEVPAEVLAEAARTLALFSLDQAWSDHLAFTQDLREGIHLRALGRQTPLHAFHAEAQAAFRTVLSSAREEAVAAFEKAVITADGLDEEASDIRRPSATWTYLVDDNPFGTPEDHLLQAFGKLVRKATGRDRDAAPVSDPPVSDSPGSDSPGTEPSPRTEAPESAGPDSDAPDSDAPEPSAATEAPGDDDPVGRSTD